MKYKRKEVIGDCTLYLADCMDVLPHLDKVDAVVTDPPYGVNLGEVEKTSTHKKGGYDGFSDTPEYVKNVVVEAIKKCSEISKRAALTPGNRCWDLYPKPDDIGIWYNPASTTRGKWGFSYVNTYIFFYGKDPRNNGNGMIPNSTSGKADSIAGIDHPCAKPLSFMKWLVNRASLEMETVLDPFMGSGTTGVSCVKLGRKFIGIELSEKYFDIACERIRQAYAQPDMFIQPEAEAPKQEALEL